MVIMASIGINRLRIKTKKLLCESLNQIKVLPTDEGLPRDWQGLAELVRIPGDRINQLQTDHDPTQKILNYWCNNSPEDSTVECLLSYLEKLDRYDIIDDIKLSIDDDIQHTEQNGASDTDPILNPIDDLEILTRDDYASYELSNGPQLYDALVLFADEDMDFATKLIDTMEKEYNLKFCTKHRDLIAGSFVLDVMIKLIEERCQRLIVIYSNNFFKSPYNEYCANFAKVVGIDQCKRKIIPVSYEPCEIPLKWRYYYTLDYDKYKRSNHTAHFWTRLNDAVLTLKPKISIQEQMVRSLSSPINKPAIAPEESSTLKAKKEGVKFSSSLVDVNNGEKEEQKTDMMPSTSTNSLHITDSECTKKKKTNWLKKILHNDTKEKIENQNSEKPKKPFFLRSSKRKAVAIAN